MKLTLSMILVVALGGRVHADEPAALPDDTVNTAGPALRDRNVALLLSAGGTLASLGLTFVPWNPAKYVGHASLLIAPTLGHWYAGKIFTTGLWLRLSATAVASIYALTARDCGDTAEQCAGEILAVGLPVTAAYVTGLVWDLATVRSRVDRRNASLFRPKITPAVLTAPTGPIMGVGISGSF